MVMALSWPFSPKKPPLALAYTPAMMYSAPSIIKVRFTAFPAGNRDSATLFPMISACAPRWSSSALEFRHIGRHAGNVDGVGFVAWHARRNWFALHHRRNQQLQTNILHGSAPAPDKLRVLGFHGSALAFFQRLLAGVARGD